MPLRVDNLVGSRSSWTMKSRPSKATGVRHRGEFDQDRCIFVRENDISLDLTIRQRGIVGQAYVQTNRSDMPPNLAIRQCETFGHGAFRCNTTIWYCIRPAGRPAQFPSVAAGRACCRAWLSNLWVIFATVMSSKLNPISLANIRPMFL